MSIPEDDFKKTKINEIKEMIREEGYTLTPEEQKAKKSELIKIYIEVVNAKKSQQQSSQEFQTPIRTRKSRRRPREGVSTETPASKKSRSLDSSKMEEDGIPEPVPLHFESVEQETQMN